MNTLEQLSSLPFILPEYLSSSVELTDTLSFRFPIQHRLAELEKLNIPISQDIPRFDSLKQPHPKIKNILAIASGKGGVGKSTITFYLALALQKMGAKVAVLDADIYGPSQSLLFNLDQKPKINANKKFIPFKRHGIEIMSIGVMSSTTQAIMWRGPMISQGLLQLYSQTDWSELDYLLVDLPPGTGDIPLTLIQKMPVTAAILVSHPHPLAKLDVDKCEHLFTHLKTPIITTVVNQSSHFCPHCEKSISNHESNQLSLPHRPEFQSMEAIAYPEFIALSEFITQKMTEYRVRKHNPFDTISVTKMGI